jgi:UDP-3-O-[3-hydroxymyristoyl] N-acetylglucosamine deacetylase
MTEVKDLSFSAQTTLRNAVSCAGIGVHAGVSAHMTIKPAAAGTGIVFRRLDVEHDARDVPARFDLVTATQLGTTLTNAAGVAVRTVEHLMSAFWGLGVDNALVELDGPEVPIMDGSAAPFVFLIECAGIAHLRAPRQVIRVLKPVSIEDGDKYAEIRPASGFSLDVEIDFPNPVIGRQHVSFTLDSDVAYKQEIARARTFGFFHEVEYLRSIGLARGGSLDNAIVIDGERILNEGGLRFPDEFVRHKALDLIGDLRLAGACLEGHVTAVRCGHDLNSRLLHRLFATPGAWQKVTLPRTPQQLAQPGEGAATAAVALGE